MKRIISLILLSVFCLTLFIVPVYAVEEYKLLVSNENEVITQSFAGGTFYSLYFDEDTPLTLQHLIDNPDLGITISLQYGGWYLYYGDASYKCYDSSLSFNSEFFSEYLTTNPSEDSLNSAIRFKMDSSGYYNGTFTYSADYVPDQDVDPTEPTDPTEDPDHSGGGTSMDDDSKSFFDGLFDDLLSGIENFLSILFKPVLDLANSLSELSETMETVWERFGTLEELWDKFKGYTIEPIVDFFESISIESLNVIMKIWEFPIIGEFSIGKVTLLFISGILLLMLTF